MFENLRQSLNDLMARATKPEERHSVLARMKETLIQAKLGVEDLRTGLDRTRAEAEAERRQLDTVRRRRALAEGIHDEQTVDVAAKYEALHAERVQVLDAKVAAQEREVALAERELDEMQAEFKRHAIGAVPPGSSAEAPPDPLADDTGASAREALDALARDQAKAARDADAERRLADLKKRMGKSP